MPKQAQDEKCDNIFLVKFFGFEKHKLAGHPRPFEHETGVLEPEPSILIRREARNNTISTMCITLANHWVTYLAPQAQILRIVCEQAVPASRDSKKDRL